MCDWIVIFVLGVLEVHDHKISVLGKKSGLKICDKHSQKFNNIMRGGGDVEPINVIGSI